ncbi:MAG TPA: epoxyqueuosine reductase [Dehalococcoidia bacterium]|nr:epoxyqueuosine reductase [Dehalococcoidia bacterium]
MLSSKAKERFHADPAAAIEHELKAFVLGSPLNRMPTTRELLIFDEPLVRFADGNDPLYKEYKTLIDPAHLTPFEALTKSLEGGPAMVPSQLSVVSWVLPITEETRITNRVETKAPSRRWSHTRYYGEEFSNEVRRFVVQVLTELGALAVAPMLQPYFRTSSNERVGLFSNWSERHTAYAAGHGTFSLSDGFITERGIAHRCGSVVTDLPLPASRRTYADHYSNCLFYVDGSCRACIERCPAGAISEQGHDKLKCMGYLRNIGYLPMPDAYDDEKSVAGCGLCQTKVPCEYGIPVKINKKTAE